MKHRKSMICLLLAASMILTSCAVSQGRTTGLGKEDQKKTKTAVPKATDSDIEKDS